MLSHIISKLGHVFHWLFVHTLLVMTEQLHCSGYVLASQAVMMSVECERGRQVM